MKTTGYFLLFFLILLVIRFYIYYTTPKPFKDGDNIRVAVTLRSEPVIYDTSQYLRIYGLKTYLPLYPGVSYGDIITLEGKVSGDRLTDVKFIRIEENGNFVYRLRKKLLTLIQKSLPVPHSSLIAGVTIGSKSGISEDFWTKLKESGTAHVVVASGMNVTLVGGFLVNFFVLFFKRRSALILALCGIWFYAVMAGFDAPIVRAAIMGSIAFTAQELGRLNASIRALVISGLVMILVNPGYIEDAGFLLSFFATLGLVLFESPLRKRLFWVPDLIRQDLSTTIAAQIGVLPLLYYFFGRVSFLSPIANAMVLWTIVPMTLIGMIGGLAGLVFEPAGTIVLWLSYPLTAWFIAVVRIFS